MARRDLKEEYVFFFLYMAHALAGLPESLGFCFFDGLPIQNEHFLKQPATSYQESHPLTQPSFMDDPIVSRDRSEARVESAREMIVEADCEILVESAIVAIVETASQKMK